MPKARIDEVREGLATVISDWWSGFEGGKGVDDEVINKTRVDIYSAKNVGRKVYIFPEAYSGGSITRGEDQEDYAVQIWVVERFREGDDPDEQWVQDRNYFVEQVRNLVGNPRLARLLAVPGEPDSGLWPETADVTTVVDISELVADKLFISVISATFREQAEVTE